jgi:hypothetical protein
MRFSPPLVQTSFGISFLIAVRAAKIQGRGARKVWLPYIIRAAE